MTIVLYSVPMQQKGHPVVTLIYLQSLQVSQLDTQPREMQRSEWNKQRSEHNKSAKHHSTE